MKQNNEILLILATLILTAFSLNVTIITGCNGNCDYNFGVINNIECPTLQQSVIKTSFNAQNNTCGMTLSIAADSNFLNFSVSIAPYTACNLSMPTSDIFIPWDILNDLNLSVCCGSLPDGTKALTSINYICSEMYNKTW